MSDWNVTEKLGCVTLYTDPRRGNAVYLRWYENRKGRKKKVADDPGTKIGRAALLSKARRRAYSKDDHLAAVKAGLAPGNDPYAELRPILADFLRWKVGRGVAPARLETIRRTCLAAWEHMGWATVADVSRRDLERYLDYLRDTCHRSARTQNRHQCDIAAPFRWAEKENRIGRNPLANMDARKGPEVRIRRVFIEDDMPAIFTATADGPAWQPLAVSLGYYGALRLREVREMTWGRANLDTQVFEFRETDQKNKKKSTIPMAPELVVMLTEYRDARIAAGLPVDGATKVLDMPSSPSASWKACLKRAGLTRMIDGKLTTKDSQGHVGDFHALRHTRLTHLAATGMALVELQDFARHSDPKITRKYVHENQARIRAGLEKAAKKGGAA